MLMNITEAADALQAEEKSVIQWIRNERLPAETVRGEYMINRADLLEWATAKGLKVDPSVFRVKDDDDGPMPTVAQAVESGGIHYGVRGTDRESVLKNVVNRLDLPPETDPEFLLQVLLTREAMGTTAIGNGIAIPHVRNPIHIHLPDPRIALCFLETPVDFGAPDGKPVSVLFTLTSPTVKVHLHLLAALSSALKDPRLMAALTEKKERETILAILTEIHYSG
jgi:PTS system nitrogen regulatory IIA component